MMFLILHEDHWRSQVSDHFNLNLQVLIGWLTQIHLRSSVEWIHHRQALPCETSDVMLPSTIWPRERNALEKICKKMWHFAIKILDKCNNVSFWGQRNIHRKSGGFFQFNKSESQRLEFLENHHMAVHRKFPLVPHGSPSLGQTPRCTVWKENWLSHSMGVWDYERTTDVLFFIYSIPILLGLPSTSKSKQIEANPGLLVDQILRIETMGHRSHLPPFVSAECPQISRIFVAVSRSWATPSTRISSWISSWSMFLTPWLLDSLGLKENHSGTVCFILWHSCRPRIQAWRSSQSKCQASCVMCPSSAVGPHSTSNTFKSFNDPIIWYNMLSPTARVQQPKSKVQQPVHSGRQARLDADPRSGTGSLVRPGMPCALSKAAVVSLVTPHPTAFRWEIQTTILLVPTPLRPPTLKSLTPMEPKSCWKNFHMTKRERWRQLHN